jgi:NAD(P)H-quinone oxidoreductase subunit 5
MARITSFAALSDFAPGSGVLVVLSGAAGILVGLRIPLDRFWSRSAWTPLRTLQDLLAADFYTERLYRATIVAFVAALARLIDSFDRRVVNGLVDRIGVGSMLSAENLRLGVSGQLQSYVLTVMAGIVLLFTSVSWFFR